MNLAIAPETLPAAVALWQQPPAIPERLTLKAVPAWATHFMEFPGKVGLVLDGERRLGVFMPPLEFAVLGELTSYGGTVEAVWLPRVGTGPELVAALVLEGDPMPSAASCPGRWMPVAVRIGAMDYEVKLWAVPAANKAQAFGLCDAANLTILIREDLKPLKAAEVLLHEILHGAWDRAALYVGGEQSSEERVVTALGNQLLQVWRDNPEGGELLGERLPAGQKLGVYKEGAHSSPPGCHIVVPCCSIDPIITIDP